MAVFVKQAGQWEEPLGIFVKYQGVWQLVCQPAGPAPWTPAALFAASELGGWYEPRDLSTVFQERTGGSATTPSTVGDFVGTILDKSGNDNHLVAPADDARPILRQTVGGHYYLEGDGVNDFMSDTSAGATSILAEQFTCVTALDRDGTTTFAAPWSFSKGNNGGSPWDDGADQWTWRIASPAIIATGTNTAPHVLSVNRTSGTSITAWYNGANSAGPVTVFDTTASPRGIALFSRRADIFQLGMEGKFFGGVWCELLDDADRALLEGYVAGLGGVAL